MKIKKKVVSAAVIGAGMLVMTACGEQKLPEEVYKEAMGNMEELESVYFTESRSLSAAEEGVGTFTRGAVTYSDPLEAYLESDMNLIDLTEPLELDFRIHGDIVEARENEQWRNYGTTRDELNTTLRPQEDLQFFLDFEEEFLMKEEEEYYEVSFKGVDERHRVLAEQKLQELGVTESLGGLDDATRESIQLNRIDMVAYIDKETMYVTGYDTRFTFSVELAGERQSFNEISNVRYDEFNNVEGNLETYMEEKIKEIQQEKMEEQEENGEDEDEQEAEE
ncbi:DUF6612 family protein [Alteribacillus iranensis]|uniref:Uncharacterized protein n=1 Tax=Alteribacillus iranensis TaxID=930128 RepID=A0A1I2BWA2_9BACI|nr:DUF6612 family protein [Alteribacillus iranensis]SFE60295.1 hypothetical protein SAMN05192532_102541 [Alteribacillus iranensis]